MLWCNIYYIIIADNLQVIWRNSIGQFAKTKYQSTQENPMFKAIKNFLFGKPDITPAPYKVETPAAVVEGETAKIAKKSPPNATAWRIENAVTGTADSTPAKKRAAKPRAKKAS
jgi:hypothetical protein